MKKTKWIGCLILGSGMSLVSCTSINEGLDAPDSAQTGKLNLQLSSNTQFTNFTRAVNENDYKNVGNYTVVVYDKTNTVKLTCRGSELASHMPLTMDIGSCKVRAFYGTEHPYSRNEFLSEDIWQGNILADQSQTISLRCEPTCGRITVNFSADMATYFTDYKVDFSGTKAVGEQTFSWAKSDTEPYYVKLEPQGEKVKFSITTTTKDDYVNSGNSQQTSTSTGSFELARNKAYKMNIRPNYTPSGDGQVSLDITIDESTIDKPVDIEVPFEWV